MASTDKQNVAHLQALLNERLAAFKNEEAKLKANMGFWVALTDLSKHLKQEFPELRDAIDISSFRALNQLDCSKLILHHDIHIIQALASMKENYKQIRRILGEAQEIVDQLKPIDKHNKNLEEVLKGLEKPRADWEKTIKKMATIIEKLG
ncbi:hypothetical protein QM012_003742 [Aureobasidium pullulans]|uniref:Uncharacterized protein n=1 Tax=Aureobasidium pullulans TaxID=5580 RepID=A0ABR0T7T1_AURPU